MKAASFYHYTVAGNVLPIKEQGLLPTVDKAFSPVHPVVWLTTQEDLSAAPKDAVALAAMTGFYEAPLSELRRWQAGESDLNAGPVTRWRYGTKGERRTWIRNGREHTVTFVPEQDDLVRMTVQLPGNDAKGLFPFVTWPDRPKSGVYRFTYKHAHVRLWYVYLGRISPDRITAVKAIA